MVVLPAARAHAADLIPKTYGAFLISSQYTTDPGVGTKVHRQGRETGRDHLDR